MNSQVKVSDEAVSQEVRGETVIMDLRSSQYFTLDDVATRIWQLINESCSPEEVLARLLDEYEVSEEELRGDIETLLSHLLDEGLITLVAEEGFSDSG